VGYNFFILQTDGQVAVNHIEQFAL
jgi:hypothetical protein